MAEFSSLKNKSRGVWKDCSTSAGVSERSQRKQASKAHPHNRPRLHPGSSKAAAIRCPGGGGLCSIRNTGCEQKSLTLPARWDTGKVMYRPPPQMLSGLHGLSARWLHRRRPPAQAQVVGGTGAWRLGVGLQSALTPHGLAWTLLLLRISSLLRRAALKQWRFLYLMVWDFKNL